VLSPTPVMRARVRQAIIDQVNSGLLHNYVSRVRSAPKLAGAPRGIGS